MLHYDGYASLTAGQPLGMFDRLLLFWVRRLSELQISCMLNNFSSVFVSNDVNVVVRQIIG